MRASAETARRIGSTNKVKVQREGCRAIRGTFDLSANLAIRAIARACAALKVPAKMQPALAPTGIDYDQRIFAFRERDWTFSLTLLHSRRRLVAVPGAYQKAALKGRKPTSATLVKRRDGCYFLHVQAKDKAPGLTPTADHLGVDLGIARIAADSDGESYSGKPVADVRSKHNLQRKRLQRRGTLPLCHPHRGQRGAGAADRRTDNRGQECGEVGEVARPAAQGQRGPAPAVRTGVHAPGPGCDGAGTRGAFREKIVAAVLSGV
jgi:hypothetical protein